MSAYYNEFDPFAASWLRELIKAGHIAPGEVDERSIVDVRPSDLAGYSQCRFFAGIGVWSHALRRAGWPDEAPIWTGSCPCQPFSAAGKGAGFDDERHLWPHFHYLIEQCQPAVVAGEQVASKDGLAWLDLVQADMEATGYAFGAVDTCAAGFGAPHIRQRLYWIGERGVWLADASGEAIRRNGGELLASKQRVSRQSCEGRVWSSFVRCSSERWLADASHVRHSNGESGGSRGEGPAPQGSWELEGDWEQPASNTSATCRLADADGWERHGKPEFQGLECNWQNSGWAQGCGEPSACGEYGRPSPTNGLWRDADWLFCRDGKWRPVEPGTFPLAHGATARVGRLRGYGNAINAEQAQGFIEAYLESTFAHK